MNLCSCGRSFGSPEARDQHRTALAPQHLGITHQLTTTNQPKPASPSKPRRPRRESWLWKDADSSSGPIHTIAFAGLESSPLEVTSSSEAQLLGTYNWQRDGTIKYPGHPPMWRMIPLPVLLKRDQGHSFVDQNTARLPQHPFRPLFEATASMSPDFRFDDVDIILNRNSLRKLFDFCRNKCNESFRVSLIMARNSLVVERNERNNSTITAGGSNGGYGHNFETAFTSPMPGIEDSTSHHRVLRYKLGDLNCVVRFEVDACYRGEPVVPTGADDDTAPESLLEGLSLQPNGSTDYSTGQHSPHMPPSMAAELKTKSKAKREYLPQLWFGRTSWLIVGHHREGTFHDVKITNVASEFGNWETVHQEALKRLITVLSQLKQGVKLNGGRNCIAVFQKDAQPRAIRIFPCTKLRQVLPKKDLDKFWNGKTAQS